MSPDGRAGVVLAGGRSTRFGPREKALADLDGRPLLAHVVAGLAPAVDDVVVNCRRDQVGPFRDALAAVPTDVAFAVDPVPDRGPAAGLATALATVSAPVAAVAACDRPFVEPALFDALFDGLGDRAAAVPRVDGHRQPTTAVYRTGPARRAARAALDHGDGSLRDAVDRLDAAVVEASASLPCADRRWFRDLNTPAALRAARDA